MTIATNPAIGLTTGAGLTFVWDSFLDLAGGMYPFARLRILVPDEPGYLARVATEVSDSGANIVEVYHQRMFHDIPAKETELDVVVETRDEEHIRQLLARLAEAGFDVRQLRDTARQE